MSFCAVIDLPLIRTVAVNVTQKCAVSLGTSTQKAAALNRVGAFPVYAICETSMETVRYGKKLKAETDVDRCAARNDSGKLSTCCTGVLAGVSLLCCVA